jgi:hypothetical protein
MVIGFNVDAQRLTRTRFALSRLAEMTNALEVLVHPVRAPYAHRWVAGVARRLDRSRVEVLLALAERATWYVPDFLVPIPDEYEPGLERELAAVAQTPADRVREELRLAFRIGPLPRAVPRAEGCSARADLRAALPVPVAAVLDAAGEEGLAQRLADELRHFWSAEMQDLWPSVRSVLDDDIRRNAVEASRCGFNHLLDNLHPGLGWDGSRVTMQHTYDATFDISPGLILMPSAFLPRLAVWRGPYDAAMVGYPARGRGQVWAPALEPGEGVGAFGERWSTLLADLSIPRSTLELSARHQLAPSTVSYHLARLHRAGLVVRQRAGQRVLYERTERASDTMAALGLVTACDVSG